MLRLLFSRAHSAGFNVCKSSRNVDKIYLFSKGVILNDTALYGRHYQKSHLNRPQTTSLIHNRCFTTQVHSHHNNANTPQNQGEHMYKGRISNMVFGVKLFSFSTSGLGVAFQPYLFMHMHEIPLFLKLSLCGSFGFFVFINPFILHYIMKSYVTDIWYDPGTRVFTAQTYSFFLRKKDLQFTADDVYVPEIAGMFTTVKVKDRNLFFDFSQFKDVEVLQHMLGYDKPLNLDLSDELKKYYENKEDKS